VKVCALEADFKSFAAGDQTEIGEKGSLLWLLYLFFIIL
jgi:hypothetical protein